MKTDPELMWLFGGILGLLVIATVLAKILKARLGANDFTQNLMARTKAWWMMCAVFAVAVLSGGVGSLVLFCVVSFLALREFITIVPTARADHRALFWLFFIAVPVQYVLIGVGWYGMFVLFIPVYAFLFLPARMVAAGDCTRFLERAAKVQWGLMTCVYCVSHAPALLKLTIPGFEGQNAKLLLFFTVTVELCDVCQYVWGKCLGRRKVLPSVSPNKTWEGLIGGVLSASVIGLGLWWATPFRPAGAFFMAFGIAVWGFLGDVTMSAIKRDSNTKDYGELIPGHGGMLDRIDSLCFAAPFFFHVTRYFMCGATPAPF